MKRVGDIGTLGADLYRSSIILLYYPSGGWWDSGIVNTKPWRPFYDESVDLGIWFTKGQTTRVLASIQAIWARGGRSNRSQDG
jgi:hypothetical protein